MVRAVGAGEDTEFAEAIDHVRGLIGGGSARIAMVDEIEAEKKAGSTNVAKKRVGGLQRLQSGDPPRADFESVLLQALVAENVKDRKAGGASDGIAAKSREKLHAVSEGRGDFRSGDDGGKRKGVADRFAEDHNVGNHVLRFESPKMSA